MKTLNCNQRQTLTFNLILSLARSKQGKIQHKKELKKKEKSHSTKTKIN